MMKVKGESRTAHTSVLNRLERRDFSRNFSVVLASNLMKAAILSRDIGRDTTPSAPDHSLSLYPHILGRTLIHPPAPFLQRTARLHLLIALRLSQHKISLTYSSFPLSIRRRMRLKRHMPLPMVALQVVQLAVLGQEASVNVVALQNHKAVKLIELNTHY